MDIIWSIVAFVVAIAVLVAIHEYGHFIVARLLGIRVLAFSIGFGRALYKKVTKSGVEFAIGIFPLGGYVKMLDDREGPVPENEKHLAFNHQVLWKRLLVVLAGPAFNILFAIVAFWAMYVAGVEHVAPVIGHVIPGSIADTAGFQRGEAIINIAGKEVYSWREVNMVLIGLIGTSKKIPIIVRGKQHNQKNRYQVNLHQWKIDPKNFNLLTSLGLEPYAPLLPAKIAKVLDQGPAAIAGLQKNDVFIAINSDKVANWQDMVDHISPNPGKVVTLTVVRQGQEITVPAKIGTLQGSGGEAYGFLGIQSEPYQWPEHMLSIEKYTVLAAWQPALVKTWHIFVLTWRMLGKLILGDISPRTISGPIGIAHGAGIYAQLGWSHYLWFLALISLSLAIVNLLPIPALDGGHALYFIIEAIRGKPLSDKAQDVGLRIGVIFIISLMIFAIFNDMTRLLNL